MSLPPLPMPNAKLFSAGALKMFGSFIWLKTNLVNKSTVLDTADEGWESSVQLENSCEVSVGWSTSRALLPLPFPNLPAFVLGNLKP